MRSIAAIAFIILGSTFHARATAPIVCTAALNSTEEIEVFKKNLQPMGFQFVELTSFSPSSQNDKEGWFKTACENKIKCDILVISGHFGGEFFGKSQLTLSMESLQTGRCSKECDGILKNPKEVFLFGCNTLSGKDKDTRTPEEYLQILRHDGIDDQLADDIVSTRYSPLGVSISDEMTEVFSGVPLIHGFKSVAPLGSHVTSMLEEYFLESGNYTQKISELEKRKKSEIAPALMQAPTDSAWSNALRLTNFTTAAGQNKIDSKICAIYDPKKSAAEKITTADQIMKGPDANKYLLFAVNYLANLSPYELSAQENALFQKVVKGSQAKKKLIGLYESMRGSPFLRADILIRLNLWKNDPDMIRLYLRESRSNDPEIQSIAISGLSGTDNEEAIRSLIELISSSRDAEFQEMIASNLEGSENPLLEQLAISLLDDKNNSTRSAACLILRHSRNPLVSAALKRRFRTPTESCRSNEGTFIAH